VYFLERGRVLRLLTQLLEHPEVFDLPLEPLDRFADALDVPEPLNDALGPLLTVPEAGRVHAGLELFKLSLLAAHVKGSPAVFAGGPPDP